jgi:hypothetical protein
MSQADLKAYADAFKAGGFRGPLNRYRAQEIDFIDFAEYAGKPVTPPSFFIAGERDPVRRFIPGLDLYQVAGAACSDFRGSVIAARRALGAAGGPGGDQRGPGRLPRADLAGHRIRPRGFESHHPASYLTFGVVPTGASLRAAAGAQSIDFWAGLYGGAPEPADGVLAVLPEHRRVVVLPNTHFDTHKSRACKRTAADP